MTETGTQLTLESITAQNDSLIEAESAFLASAEAYLKASRGKLTAISWNWENVTFGGYAQSFFDLTLHLEGGVDFYLGEQHALDERAELLDQLLHVLDYSEEAEEQAIAQHSEDANAVATKLLSELTGISVDEVAPYLHLAFAWLNRNEQRDGRTRMDLIEQTCEPLAEAA